MKPLILAAAVGLTASAAGAITVNEFDLGDFGNNENTGVPGTPAQLGALDEGVNTISGRLNVVCSGPITPSNCALLDVLDGFEFTVSQGLRVTDATIEIATEGEPDAGFAFSITGSAAGQTSTPDVFGLIMSTPFAPEQSFLTRSGSSDPAGPLDAGLYRIVAGYPAFGQDSIAPPPIDDDLVLTALAPTQIAFGTSWTVRLTTETIAPVPLPATLPLALAALGGLAWVRRRKT